MTPALHIHINGNAYTADPGTTVLEACKQSGVTMYTLCELEGLSHAGACRLCLVEIEGNPKLQPACTTRVTEGMRLQTDTAQLRTYRRMTVELFFAERNHICAVCVANGHCALQSLAYAVGMDHVRFPMRSPACTLDASHGQWVLDHNRCILCTRCVRTCDEVEGAHHWDVMGRGIGSRIIGDFDTPWGQSETCTSCGKCMHACPTGAIFPKTAVQGSLEKHPEMITTLMANRKSNS